MTPTPLVNQGTGNQSALMILKPVFAMSSQSKELNDTDRYIEIPQGDKNFYKMYKPSPLVAYTALRRSSDHQFVQVRGNLRAGRVISSAPAMAQGTTLKRDQGVTTGGLVCFGQWEPALSMACSYLDSNYQRCTWLRFHMNENHIRREVMRTYGASVTPCSF